jgi:hypothetical protein
MISLSNMSVNNLLLVIEFLVARLYAAGQKHNKRANDLGEQIKALKYEQTINYKEAERAKRVADKMADLIS